ncbi:SGNH/GDSL hydrolase family protein [Bacillus timonensis]|nr:SGNH/GDSL hydrolase family protein [Bacillus timonensis]
MLRTYSVICFLCFSLFIISSCSSQAEKVSLVPESKHVLREKVHAPSQFFLQELKIVGIGDSLTEGIGDTTKNGGYLFFLEDYLVNEKTIKTVDTKNFGVKGHKTTDLLKRLKNNEIKGSIAEADIVIITIGGNDMMKVTKENIFNLSFETFEDEQEDYGDRLNDILEEIRGLNTTCEIVLVGLYNPFYSFLDLLNELNLVVQTWNNKSIEVLSQYEGTTFVPVDDIFISSEEKLLYKDEFHPNTRGYELIAKRIFDTIKE